MGALSTTKFNKISGNEIIEEAALTTSAGAADAQKLPALNASGFLDPTIINGKTTSAGPGDSGKVVQLGADGLISDTMLPVGYELGTAVASEAIAAGKLVQVYDVSGVATMRVADAGSNKPANGFVKAAVASGATGTFYTEGLLTGLTGLTVGPVFLGTSGALTSTGPTAAGSIWQPVGMARSATAFLANFEKGVVRA